MSCTAASMLPPELTDEVIDHLHDDIPSLRACSLVCRAWVPSARFHIFHDVKLSAGSSMAFADLLETSPHIPFFVRSLDIHENSAKIYDRSDFLDVVLIAIAQKLTRLESLQLTNVNLAQLHPVTQSAFIHHFADIRRLSLCAVTFDTFRDFAALIVAHPYIEDLDLRYIWWKNAPLNTPSRWEDVFHSFSLARPHLHNLSLNDTSFNVVDWIMSQYPSLPINSITNSTILKYDIPSVARLFQFLGPTLEHLTICVHSIPRYPLGAGELAKATLISSNTGLRTIFFDRLILTHRGSPHCAWVPVILSQVTSQIVEEITFSLVWNQLDPMFALDLEQIERLLMQPRFDGLKRVIFRSVGYLDPVVAVNEISRRMPRLIQRGLFAFYQDPLPY